MCPLHHFNCVDDNPRSHKTTQCVPGLCQTTDSSPLTGPGSSGAAALRRKTIRHLQIGLALCVKRLHRISTSGVLACARRASSPTRCCVPPSSPRPPSLQPNGPRSRLFVLCAGNWRLLQSLRCPFPPPRSVCRSPLGFSSLFVVAASCSNDNCCFFYFFFIFCFLFFPPRWTKVAEPEGGPANELLTKRRRDEVARR